MAPRRCQSISSSCTKSPSYSLAIAGDRVLTNSGSIAFPLGFGCSSAL